MNIDWATKYTPVKITDIISNRDGANQIYNWLNTFNRNKNKIITIKKNNKKINNRILENMHSCLIITGNHGSGKTSIVKTILKNMGYMIENFNLNNIKNGTNIKQSIKNQMISSDVMKLMTSSKQKSVLLIDEIESITSTTDKNALLTLQKLNDIEWYYPIIFIANNQHNKLISEIKKGSEKVKLHQPTDQEMEHILKNICKKENINITGKGVIKIIIEHSQSDIRRLINTLQDIKYAYGDNEINMERIIEYCNSSKLKDADIDLYKATNGLLYDYKNINTGLRLYETEKVLLPLMIHQNYIKNIMTNVPNKEDQLAIIKKISESLVMGDIVENYIYGYQNWDMQDIHGYYTCVGPSYYSKKAMVNPTKINTEFTADLNKTSIKNINKKNISKTNQCMTGMNINDYIYINKIIRKLLDENKIEECVSMLKNYNIKLEHIESLLKIDKIKNSKTILTSKQKKELQKYLE
jgi:DNA polymerase III delta prime subunit